MQLSRVLAFVQQEGVAFDVTVNRASVYSGHRCFKSGDYGPIGLSVERLWHMGRSSRYSSAKQLMCAALVWLG